MGFMNTVSGVSANAVFSLEAHYSIHLLVVESSLLSRSLFSEAVLTDVHLTRMNCTTHTIV
jgi:hypothetical protein